MIVKVEHHQNGNMKSDKKRFYQAKSTLEVVVSLSQCENEK
jgi:hypothetical protein